MSKSGKIHIACAKGEFDTVKSLLEGKCDIEERGENDQRPIHFACANGHVDIVKLLMEYNCEIESCDENNWQPIHFASRFGSVPIVKLLIAHRCDMNALTKDNKSPMNISKQYNHRQLINIMEYESDKEKLIAKIKKAPEVECGSFFIHKSCPKGLIPTGSQKKDVIGSGQYGKVYKLTYRKINYALKSIELDNEGAKDEVKYLTDYINNKRDMKHPRIVQYFGSFSYLKMVYIFMEFVPKGSLDDEIQKAEFLQYQRTLRYTKQILEGVEFLHEKRVMHRNIRPGNILLDEEDSTKLCDFGTSKLLTSVSIRSKRSTDNGNQYKGGQANTYCGTANYMAPEVIQSHTGVKYSFPADIWSVGATIVHMLTGQPPYFGTHQATVIFKIAMEKKIDFEPREPMSDEIINMILFVKETLNPDPSTRATAKQLLQFLIDHNMT